MLVSEVLSRAADLIEPEGAWTQGGYAVVDDVAYLNVENMPREATCFCAAGAIAKVGGVQKMWRVADWVGKAAGFPYGNRIINWNDAHCRTQGEVVAKLREAAALAKEQGQ